MGDPVTPSPVDIPYPALLGEPFSLLGYPLETVLAEKIVTMVDRGDATTRERDFADVYALTSRHAVDAASLSAAVQATGAHRGSDLRRLADVVVDLADLRQVDWRRFVARAGLAGDVPASYAEAIEAIAAFADPILSGDLTEGRWDPGRRRWRRPS